MKRAFPSISQVFAQSVSLSRTHVTPFAAYLRNLDFCFFFLFCIAEAC